MWIFTTVGFLSVVTDGERPGNLLVRARARKDIETFAAATDAPVPLETPNRDYRWRTSVPAATFATWLAQQGEAIDYPNFKSAVADRQGYERASRYGDVWQVMYGLQTTEVNR